MSYTISSSTDIHRSMSVDKVAYGQYVVSNPTLPGADENACVNFKVGQPSRDNLLPSELVRQHMVCGVGTIVDPDLLQYGDITGYEDFRKDLSKYLGQKYNEPVGLDDLFITNGITDALTMIASLVANKDTVVYIEEPTYFLALNIFKNDFNLSIETIPMTPYGLDIHYLRKRVRFNNSKGKKQLLYTITAFHNPTSVTLSHENRILLAKVAHEETEGNDDMVIIEDGAYQLLYFDDDDVPPLPMCFYHNNSISLGSFSKILAPSLRLGWMHSRSKELMDLFKNSGQSDSSGGKSPIIQSLVHTIVSTGDLEKNILHCRKFLEDNCKFMSKLVREKLSEFVDFVEPSGGYFLWLKVKEGYNVKILSDMVESHGTNFLPGSRFAVGDECDRFIRLSFSYYNEKAINIGIDRLKNLFMSYHSKYLSTNIVVNGSTGRLGKLIVSQLDLHKDFIHHDIFKGGASHQSMDDMKPDEFNGINCIIDVSSNESCHVMVHYLINTSLYIPIVVGTTGLDKKTLDLLAIYSSFAPVVIVPNFSEGVSLTLDVLKTIKKHNNKVKSNAYWKTHLIDIHHINKKDHPSGTAKNMMDTLDDKDLAFTYKREGDVVGIHTLELDSEMESITITHTAKDRRVFAVGAVRYAGWIINQKPGWYVNMEPRVIKFSKYSGCGNDFIIINNRDVPISCKESSLTKLCNRHTSIGADGLIIVDDVKSEDIDIDLVKWTYYNADGSCVKMCGNGARCVAKYLIDNGHEIDGCVLMNTHSGILTKIICDINCINGFKIKMPMSSMPHFTKNISFNPGVHVTVGVPHLVKQYMDVNDFETAIIDTSMINQINHNIISQFATDTESYTMIRTHERGVGETMACGTGCCSAAIYMMFSNIESNTKPSITCRFVGRNATPKELGDIITVDVEPYTDYSGTRYQTWLSGPACKVYDGEFDI